MDDASFFQEVDHYRMLAVDQLIAELRALRSQMQNPHAALEDRSAAIESFGVAWHIYTEKGGYVWEDF